MRQLSELMLREQTRMWNVFTKSLFSEAPSLFVVLQGNRRDFDPRRLFSEGYQIHLLCQHPAGPHIVNGEPGYPAPQDRDWWRKVSPWLRQVAKILKFVPHLSGVVKAYDETWFNAIDLGTELFDATNDVLPDFADHADRTARKHLGTALAKDVEADGAALRALHAFLREVDKPQH